MNAIGLGRGERVPPTLSRCFDPSGCEWEDIEPPQPDEWLDAMLDRTPDQSFKDYLTSRPNIPEKSARKVIYLQPLGSEEEMHGPRATWPSWEALETAVQRFYGPLEVRSLPPVAIHKLKPVPTSRMNAYGVQFHAGEILECLKARQAPKDAYCTLAVTMNDLYPRPEWNFVYGLASLQARVGVFSFARHAPPPEAKGTEATRQAKMLHSSMKTMLHEIGHMFGLKHCTWFNCLMRGSNGEGVEHQPNHLHLCPVCLRKLHWNIGFDISTYYASLLDLFQAYEDVSIQFQRDCDFLRQRLTALADLPPNSTKTATFGSEKVLYSTPRPPSQAGRGGGAAAAPAAAAATAVAGYGGGAAQRAQSTTTSSTRRRSPAKAYDSATRSASSTTLRTATAGHEAVNEQGAPVKLGNANYAHLGYDGSSKYYCGRRLGAHQIPGSDGQCGPCGGPQCRSCQIFQAEQAETPRSRRTPSKTNPSRSVQPKAKAKSAVNNSRTAAGSRGGKVDGTEARPKSPAFNAVAKSIIGAQSALLALESPVA